MELKNAITKTVTKIYADRGEVRASVLLELSTPKRSPTHGAFTWDNKTAGHEFRLIQARQLIRTVHIVIEDRTERLIHVGVERSEGEGYYKPMSIVVSSKPEFDAAMSETLSRLNSTKAAYADLKAAAAAAKDETRDFARADQGFGMIQEALA